MRIFFLMIFHEHIILKIKKISIIKIIKMAQISCITTFYLPALFFTLLANPLVRSAE